MSFSVTPEILEALNIEIDITRELQSEISSWRYLYRWGKTVPEKNDAFNAKVQLLVEGRVGSGDPRESKGILAVLKQKLLGANQSRQTLSGDVKELQIRGSASRPEEHVGQCSRMQFFVVVDGDRTNLFQIRTDGAELLVDAGGFRRELIDIQQCYYQGAGLTGYVGVAKTRLRVTLKLFAAKDTLIRPAVNATSFEGYSGIPLPYYSTETAQQPARVMPIRTHPFLEQSLRCPAIISNKMLVEQNKFIVGIHVTLDSLTGLPGADYVIQAELRCKEPWHAARYPTEDGVQAMKVTHVTRTGKAGRGALNTLWNLYDEFGGFSLRESGDDLRNQMMQEGIPLPGEMVFKLFQITAEQQLIYCGFCPFMLSPFPGRCTQSLNFVAPKYNKAQQEKIYFMHSTFGAVPAIDQRVLLGLLADNQRFSLQMTVETFHFLPSEDAKKIKEKMGGLQAVMGKAGLQSGPGLATKLFGLGGVVAGGQSELDLRETVQDPRQGKNTPQDGQNLDSQGEPAAKRELQKLDVQQKPKPLVLGQGMPPIPKLKTQPKQSGAASTKLGEPSSDIGGQMELKPQELSKPVPKPASKAQEPPRAPPQPGGKPVAPKLNAGKLASLLSQAGNK